MTGSRQMTSTQSAFVPGVVGLWRVFHDSPDIGDQDGASQQKFHDHSFRVIQSRLQFWPIRPGLPVGRFFLAFFEFSLGVFPDRWFLFLGLLLQCVGQTNESFTKLTQSIGIHNIGETRQLSSFKTFEQ
jgi:hypothetical protein